MRRLASAVLGAAAAASGSGGEGSCPAGGCSQASTDYYWPNVRGVAGRYGVSNLTAPKDLSKPSWRWHHPDGQYIGTVVGGPVIDGERNLYVTEMKTLMKMSPDGQVIWGVRPPEPHSFPDGPSIYGGSVFQSVTDGSLCSFSMDSGQRQWCHKYYPETGFDSKYVTSHDGVVVIGTDNAHHANGGSRHVIGVDAESGTQLWAFMPDSPTWNNMGMFTDDDTFVLQDWDAKVYRVGLHNGSLLWKSGGAEGRSWTDGGTIIGANGVVYSAFSNTDFLGCLVPNRGGGIRAYRLSDGKLLWTRTTQHGVFTWPVAGRLHDGDERWTVVVAAGPIPPCRPWRSELVDQLLVKQPSSVAIWLLLELFLALCFGSLESPGLHRRALSRLASVFVLNCLLSCYNCRRWANGLPSFPAEITAFDAETGSVRWHYDLPAWERVAARGDEEGFFSRKKTPWREMCCPASFGSPTVDGDGVVYIGHVSGLMYAIKDRNADGWIDESEVQTFDAEAAFLHSGPALAPGIFAFSTCDSVWAWRT